MPILPLRIAVYARYSVDIQNPTSIEDQVRACNDFIGRHFQNVPREITVFEDAALSGATIERPGIQSLIRFVRGQQIDVIIAEGIDRLSRSISDMSIMFDLFVNANVRLLTIHEGEVSDLHVGMKGTMNKVFLKDLKERIRRGQSGRTLAGYVMGVAPFGYRTVRGVVDAKGRTVNGVKEIDPAAAKVVQDIFEMFADGRSAVSIADEINSRGIARPRSPRWSDYNIRKMVRNRFYIGENSYRKTTIYRDPLTGKRRIKKLPSSEWTVTQQDELRIISDDLWRRTQARIARIVEPEPKKPKKDFAPHQRVLTGYVFCGTCGSIKHVANQTRYVCSRNRYEGTCSNGRGTKEKVVRDDLFDGLFKAVAALPPLRPTILKIYDQDSHRQAELERQQEKIQDKIDRLMQAVEDGVDMSSAVERIKALQVEKVRLKEAKSFHVLPTIGSEEEIKKTISRALTLLRTEPERGPVRAMLAALKLRIVMTPIVGKYRGETISIELPPGPDPWVRFWMMLQR